MQKKILSLIIIFLFSSDMNAYENILTTTDNDDNNEIYKLVLNVDENTQELKELFKDTYVNDVKIRRDILDPEDLKTRNGIILEKRDNFNVLNLKSSNFDYALGGRIIIDTLYNGISGERRNYELELAKDKVGWKLFKNQKTISKFHVKTNKVIILGTVGIKTIIME